MLLKDWLAHELESRNLRSLREAGRQIGVAHTTIQRLLAGASVDVATLEKLAEWSGVNKVTLLQAMGIHMPVDTTDHAAWDMISGRYPELADPLKLLIERYRNGELRPDAVASIGEFIKFTLRAEE